MSNPILATLDPVPTECVSTISIPLDHVLTFVFELVPKDPLWDALDNAGAEDISDVIILSDFDIDHLRFCNAKGQQQVLNIAKKNLLCAFRDYVLYHSFIGKPIHNYLDTTKEDFDSYCTSVYYPFVSPAATPASSPTHVSSVFPDSDEEDYDDFMEDEAEGIDSFDETLRHVKMVP